MGRTVSQQSRIAEQHYPMGTEVIEIKSDSWGYSRSREKDFEAGLLKVQGFEKNKCVTVELHSLSGELSTQNVWWRKPRVYWSKSRYR